MNEDKILWFSYKSRLQSCELLSTLLDQHKEELDILHKLSKQDHANLKLSELSNNSLKEIKKDQLIMVSRLQSETFMHIAEIKKIGRILKLRKKPVLDDD